MQNKTIVLLFISILAVTSITSCKHDVPQPVIVNNNGNNGGGNGNGNGNGSLPPCDPDSVYFDQQVLPILVSNCTMSGCHNSTTHAEGIDLTSYAAVMASDVVKPTHPYSSDLYKAITDNDPDDVMPPPPAAHLLTAQINLIKNWILQGAQNLHCDAGCDTTYVTYSNTIAPMMTTYCNGCHSGANPSGGLDYTTYSSVSDAAADGSLFGSVSHDPNWSAMPKNSAMLPQCKIDQIRIWVNAGAPNN